MDSATSATIFEFGGKGRLFVSGLIWHPIYVAQPTKARKAKIVSLAEEYSCDLYVTRMAGSQLVGLGRSSDGLKPGMMSAAAMISKTAEMKEWGRSFLCVIPVPNTNGKKWLYVHQYEGSLLPDGDRCDTEDRVKTAFVEALSQSDFETIIAPAHWAIKKSRDLSFEDLFEVQGKKFVFRKWWQLAPVRVTLRQRLRALVPVMILVLLSTGGLIGIRAYKDYKAKQEWARVQALNAAAERESAKQKLLHPWRNMPRAPLYIRECVNSLPRSFWPGNWTFKDATCENGSTTIRWDRATGGMLSQLKEVLPNVNATQDGEHASLTIPWKAIPFEDEQVLKAGEASSLMVLVSQHYGIPIKVTTPLAPPQLPGDSQKTAADAKPDWQELRLSVGPFQLDPSEVVNLIDEPGIRITNAKYSQLGNGIYGWTLEGVVYAKN